MSILSLPNSWSSLTWQQLCDCWQVKMRYGGNANVARVAALLALCGLVVCRDNDMTLSRYHEKTGETLYRLQDRDGTQWTVTPREASQMARQVLTWFDYPYGDPGEKEELDENGKIIKERREAVPGYVSNSRDAMILPRTETTIGGFTFALPQVACNNLTWQQYRTLQAIVPQLFTEGIKDQQTVDLQAQFLAHCLVPARLSEQTADRFRPKRIYRYDAERAEQTVEFWRGGLSSPLSPLSSLFHICFQCYQTALLYYEKVYPLLFAGGKQDTMRDALQGEVGTVNTVMKYAGYSEQQQVYDSNLPFILDILNTMTKEAKEIEKMNAKIKKK